MAKLVQLKDKDGMVYPKLFDSGWITTPLQNGWVNYGSTYTVPSYRKIGNVVFIRGMVKNGSIANNEGTTPIFTLPVGYRPSYRYLFSSKSSAATPSRTDVFPNGVVQAVEGANAWFSVDGICFIAEQ